MLCKATVLMKSFFVFLKVIEELKQGNVLHEPAHCPQRIYKIVMVKCWTYEPDERPKFGDLRAHLVSVSKTNPLVSRSLVVDFLCVQ